MNDLMQSLERNCLVPRTLIKKVRRELRISGVTPVYRLWQLTLTWTKRLSDSYMRVPGEPTQQYERRRWPSPHEVASMYLLYLYLEAAPRLPYRARPESSTAYIPPPGLPSLQLPHRPLPPPLLPPAEEKDDGESLFAV